MKDKKYIVIARDFSITNIHNVEMYSEVVVIKAGCVLEIKQVGVFKKVYVAKLPHKLPCAPYTAVVCTADFMALQSQGYTDGKTYSEGEVKKIKGASKLKWESQYYQIQGNL